MAVAVNILQIEADSLQTPRLIDEASNMFGPCPSKGEKEVLWRSGMGRKVTPTICAYPTTCCLTIKGKVLDPNSILLQGDRRGRPYSESFPLHSFAVYNLNGIYHQEAEPGVNAQFKDLLSEERLNCPHSFVRTVDFGEGFEPRVFDFEIYFVNAKNVHPAFDRYGVYIDWLRFLFPPVLETQEPTNPVVAPFHTRVKAPSSYDKEKCRDEYRAYVVDRLHYSTKFRYETYSGAMGYCAKFPNREEWGVHFLLGAWLRDFRLLRDGSNADFRVNCFDCASLVYLALALSDDYLSARLIYFEFDKPKWFISPCSLIGFSNPCNSPLFAEDEKSMLVKADDNERTAFGSHLAACIAKRSDAADQHLILDACAGPVPNGDKSSYTVKEYFAVAKDIGRRSGSNTTELYKGVVDFDRRPTIRPSNYDIEETHPLIKAIQEKQSEVQADFGKPQFSKLPTFLSNKLPLTLTAGWHVSLSRPPQSDEASGSTFIFKYDHSSTWYSQHQKPNASDSTTARIPVLHIKIHVTPSIQQANGVLNEITAHSERFVGSQHEALSQTPYTLFSLPNKEPTHLTFCMGPYVVEISGLNTVAALRELADAVRAFFTEGPHVGQKQPPGVEMRNFRSVVNGIAGPKDAPNWDVFVLEVAQVMNFTCEVKDFFDHDWTINTGCMLVLCVTAVEDMDDGYQRFHIAVQGRRVGEDLITFEWPAGTGDPAHTVRQPVSFRVV